MVWDLPEMMQPMVLNVDDVEIKSCQHGPGNPVGAEFCVYCNMKGGDYSVDIDLGKASSLVGPRSRTLELSIMSTTRPGMF